MAAVRHNLMDMVKVLIFATDDRTVWSAKETTQVDLTLQDIDGKSVIHFCVKNREVRGALSALILVSKAFHFLYFLISNPVSCHSVFVIPKREFLLPVTFRKRIIRRTWDDNLWAMKAKTAA